MKYLSKGIGQCHGKKEVCIGASSVDPEVPEDRAEGGGEKEHHQDNQGVAKVYMQGRERMREGGKGESDIKNLSI